MTGRSKGTKTNLKGFLMNLQAKKDKTMKKDEKILRAPNFAPEMTLNLKQGAFNLVQILAIKLKSNFTPIFVRNLKQNALNSARNIAFIVLGAFCINACSSESEFDAMGMFKADEIIISAQNSGEIVEFLANEGQNFAQGKLCARIDTTQLELTRDKVQLQHANATRERARLGRLYRANAGTKKSYDDALLNEQILAKELDLLSDSIEKASIKAPINGVVLEKYANLGELASPAKPLFKLADTSKLRLKAYLINADISKVALGDEVAVFADYDGGLKEYKGVVSWISPKAQFTPKTIMSKDERENLVYAVKIDVPNPQGELKIGAYGQIKLKK